MVTISKATLVSSIWNNFYNRIKDQVTSVTSSITGPNNSNIWTIQTYASSYSDVDFKSSSNFPILVINSPKVPQEQFTFKKTNVNGTIDIEIYATNSQVVDKFLDAINNAIETYKHEFAGVGLTNLELDDTLDDFVEHGNIKVHIRTSRWRFNYKFERTTGF